MIRKYQALLNAVNRIVDVGLIVASYYLALYIWLDVIRNMSNNVALLLGRSVWVSIAYALLVTFVYRVMGLYDSLRARSVPHEITRVLEGNAIAILGAAALLYLLRLQEFSRGVLLLFYLLSCALILAKRLLTRFILNHYRAIGYNQKHLLLIGSGPHAGQFIRSVKAHPSLGYAIDGYFGEKDAFPALRCLGEIDDLEQKLNSLFADKLVAALESGEERHMQSVIFASEKSGVKLSIIPYYNDYIPACSTLNVIGESKLINVRQIPLDRFGASLIKRTMDVLCALVLIMLTSPIMLVAAIGVKLSSPGPVLFRQQRVGKNRKLFTMYKFRSMRVNAVQDSAWTKNDDPRKTKFGSFIRKTSIDELPQFFNVLKGDMSLVGPRPEIPKYVNEFRKTVPLYMVKHRVRPGITGWAQVNGYRGDTSIEERVRCDIWYIENWSIFLDIRICFMTAFGGMFNKEKLK